MLQLQATEASVGQLTRLFDLELAAKPWAVGAERYDVPPLLSTFTLLVLTGNI